MMSSRAGVKDTVRFTNNPPHYVGRMNPQGDSGLISSAKAFSRMASAGIMFLGVLLLFGWAFDIPALKSVFPGLVTMKANTALAFILAGLSLRLLGRAEADQPTRLIAHLCALIVALIGLLALCEYLFGWDFGIDTLLFQDQLGAMQPSPPGRMAPTTALCFLLAGAALLLLDIETRRGYRLAQPLILTEGLISFLVLIGYAYEVQGLYTSAPYSSMALHKALAFIILCIGVLFARPDRGVMSLVVSENVGGVLARRLLLSTISALVGLGWLWIFGEDIGLYSSRFGVLVMV